MQGKILYHNMTSVSFMFIRKLYVLSILAYIVHGKIGFMYVLIDNFIPA